MSDNNENPKRTLCICIEMDYVKLRKKHYTVSDMVIHGLQKHIELIKSGFTPGCGPGSAMSREGRHNIKDGMNIYWKMIGFEDPVKFLNIEKG